MGDGWTTPEFTYFLGLLAVLIQNCADCREARRNDGGGASPKNAGASGAGVSAGGVPWPDLDAKLVVLKPFLQRLLQEASSKKRARYVNEVMCTLLTENLPLTEGVVGLISLGIEEHHEDVVRCYFRVINALLGIRDSLAPRRLALTLSSLLNAMESQQQYWKMTDFCIEHLIRLAKRYESVYVWLNANGQKLSWMLDWLFMHANPPRQADLVLAGGGVAPVGAAGTGIQMHKPHRHEKLAPSYGPTGISTVRKKAALDAIKDGLALEKLLEPETEADAGDRTWTRLEWVDIRDTVSKWCLGQIVDVAEGRVLAHYDGWPSKWDEWLDVGSPRLAPAGKNTTKDDWKRRKGWVDPNAKPVTPPASAPAPAAVAPAAATAATAAGAAPAPAGAPAGSPLPPLPAAIRNSLPPITGTSSAAVPSVPEASAATTLALAQAAASAGLAAHLAAPRAQTPPLNATPTAGPAPAK